MLYTIITLDTINFYDIDYILVDNVELPINDNSITFITEFKNEYEFKLYPFNNIKSYDISIKTDYYKHQINVNLFKYQDYYIID